MNEGTGNPDTSHGYPETETVEQYVGSAEEPYKTSRFEKVAQEIDESVGPASGYLIEPMEAQQREAFPDDYKQPLPESAYLEGKDTTDLEDPVPYATYRKAVDDLTKALVHTAEYVGQKTLPPIRGWSWFDALVEYAPEKAKVFRDPKFMDYEITVFDEHVGLAILELGAVNSTGVNAILKNLCGLNQHYRDKFMRSLIDSGSNTLQGDKNAEDLSRYTIMVNRTHI